MNKETGQTIDLNQKQVTSTMNPFIEKYLELLWRMFEFDIEQLSQPWMYYWLLVPAISYLVFFFVKWAVLTTPIWLPVSIIFKAFGDIKKK